MFTEKLYQRLNDTAADYPREASLHQLIAEACEKFADRTAIRSGDDSVTFRQFDEASNQLANYLIERGVRKGDLVGVCCERNCDTPILLNAILRAGASYVPLDPEYPVERLQYMTENSGLQLVVAHDAQRHLVGKLKCDAVFYDKEQAAINGQPDTAPDVAMNSVEDVAYVIYTSGSTGKPKGVLVPHQSVVNLLVAFQTEPGFTHQDRLLATTTLSFDISVIEFFLPLVAGGELVIVDREIAKDQVKLVKAIKKYDITFMQATASHWRVICEADFHGGSHMKFVSGGEPLPRDLIDPLLERCGGLWNCYGPTETTVYSSIEKIENSRDRILVGPPLPNTTAYVVDDDGVLCAAETEGELWVGGDCVAKSYLKRDELTKEKFVDFNGERVYRTGDLARILESGKIEILGRIDSQVKIRGHRIELGEIDAVMASADENVRLAAAVVRKESAGDLRLVGYVLPHEGKTVDLLNLKSKIEKRLPEYMVPSVITVIDEFPYTPSGKTDRKAFPAPSTERPELGTEFIEPANDHERQLAAVWCEILQFDRVGTQDNFFELGGDSIKAVKAVKRSNEVLQASVSNAEFFDGPTIGKFIAAARNSSVDRSSTNKPNTTSDRTNSGSNEFAVVGLAVKLPGAKNTTEFWNNLCEGKETIRFFSEDELDPTLPSEVVQDASYVKARGVIDDADHFDARFFNVPPREAELVDPQQRIMLELAWIALEDAGCIPSKFDGKIGVWAGTYETSYFTKNLLTNPELVQQTGEFQLGVYNEKDYIATRVAHKLNLNGPAINVNTACSTSLVAIIQACQSLAAGFCDAAIAGAASVHFPQNSGHLHQEGSIFSPDGHCRPFDAESGGTLFSDGAGAVVIKRLEDAVADGDRVYAVIKGFGLNNDGGEKASFSAPSIEGQSDAITMAHRRAGIKADSLGYIEAHGTATPIGDPIEVAALTRAFGTTTDKKQFCGIGSVKSNVGHTVAAAGVTGFVKTVLALHHEQIPATLHFNKPNPQIDFAATPFFVCDKLQQWKRSNEPRLAGISSFGVGGTNAHIVVQESPAVENNSNNDQQAPCLLPLSAKSETALEEAAANLASSLNDSEFAFDDVVNTLTVGREQFNWRGFCVVDSNVEAATKLNKNRLPDYVSRKSSPNRKTVFMFPGQGAQYVRMGQILYEQLPVFKKNLDECCEILKPLLKRDLRDVLFPESGDEEESQEILKATQYTQPALFAIGYSLAKTLQSLDIQPTAMIGHSIGEFAAACVAGVFSLEDGLNFIARRAELMQALPGGSMLSVRMYGSDVEPMLSGDLAIASFNGPQLCVVAGPDEEVEKLHDQLKGQGVACKHLHTSHAFHSPMMDSIVGPFEKFIAETTLAKPQIPILSTVTGKWMTDEQAVDPAYWAQHLRKPVRFSEAVSQIWNEDNGLVLLELGPRKTLATLAMQHAEDRKTQFAIPTMADNADDFVEWRQFLMAIGQLWSLGVNVDLKQFIAPTGRVVSLPTYPFQRKRFLVPPGTGVGTVAAVADAVVGTEMSKPSVAVPVAKDASCAVASQASPHVSLNQPNHQISPFENYSTTTNYGPQTMSRIPQIIEAIQDVFENSSGFDLSEFESDTTFFEIGLDSLVLTQTATALKNEFGVTVTFRQLLEETTNVALLAEFLDGTLPADRFAAPVVAVQEPVSQPANDLPATTAPVDVAVVANNQPVQPTPVQDQPTPTVLDFTNGNGNGNGTVAESVINKQLQLMAAQLQLLGGGNVASVANPTSDAANVASGDQQQIVADRLTEPNHGDDDKSNSNDKRSSNPPQGEPVSTQTDKSPKKAFGAAARVSLNSEALSDKQQAKLDEIIRLTNEKMPSSKTYAQQHRQYMADPRTVSGFRPNMKEMTHPIVVEKSKGVHLWDVDGNQYVDYTCGFGSNFLGHGQDLIIDAVNEQLPKDYSIGPQSPLAGEVARLFCELTGSERMAFSNTGSEAVLGCTRLARTYTGKQKVVMFTGDYHGILDEVIVRGNKNFRSFPAATGIPREHVDNTLILEYGDERSLEIIRENLDDLAAVVVETVQSRRPELQPQEFLLKLRALTEDVDTALIFDEVITGFRIAPGGAQEHFGIRADLASYGKVVGGGMPIGLIGGRAKYMDGLDGGFWQYGDASRPEAGMTYFAGTFVRHPLTLAASKAILEHIKQGGHAMYRQLNDLSDNLAEQLNAMFKELDAPMFLANFGSLFKVQFEQELPYSELVFASLRLKGFHIWDHRPCLLTVAHRQDHVDAFVKAFRETVIELQAAGFVPGEGYKNFAAFDSNRQPCDGAKVGKDRDGKPGWFVPDNNNPGQFVQVNQCV